jgi:hypothetical protein
MSHTGRTGEFIFAQKASSPLDYPAYKNRSQIFARFLIVRIKFPIWLPTDLCLGKNKHFPVLFYNLAGMQSLGIAFAASLGVNRFWDPRDSFAVFQFLSSLRKLHSFFTTNRLFSRD